MLKNKYKRIICILLAVLMAATSFLSDTSLFGGYRNQNGVYAASGTDGAASGGDASSETSGQGKSAAYAASLTADDSGDGITVTQFDISYESGANKVETVGDKTVYVWTAENANSGHRFTFNINYTTKGTYDLEQGKLCITIPKSILCNRDGEAADYYEMSVPAENEADETTTFVYKESEDGKSIIIYNHLPISAAQNGYFQISYLTSDATFEYYDYSADSRFSVSQPFHAVLTMKDAAEVSENLYVGLDTQVKIDSTNKKTPVYYDIWQGTWGEEVKPENDGDYFYLVWEVESVVSSASTQEYGFTLSDTFTETEYDKLAGYRMSGSGMAYTEDPQTVEGLKLTGRRYDYVLTMHDKAHYNKLLETDGEYSVKNAVTATVIPSDEPENATSASSQRTYTKLKPEFKPQIGSAAIGKSGNIRKYDLSVLKRGQDTLGQSADKVEGLTYSVSVEAYPYEWTLPDDGDPDNPEDYGQKTILYTLTDNELYFGSDTEPLSKEDYEIASLSFSYRIRDAVYNETECRFETDLPTFSADEVFHIYIEYEGEWIELGTYHLSTGTFSFEAADTIHVQSADSASRTLTFDSGVTGYRITTENAHYFTYINAKPSVTIKRSEAMKAKTASDDVKEAAFKNVANLTVSDPEAGEGQSPYINKNASATDYIQEENRQSSIKKTVVSSANNTKTKSYSITWKVSMQETITNNYGLSYVYQDSGVFYDLLPEGCEVDLSSVIVETDAGFLDSSAYEAEVFQNYRNSGRTLLAVRIKESGGYYNLMFDTVHTWESIMDYGNNILNPVAYETGNDNIKNGYPDNGGSGELKYRYPDGTVVDNTSLFADLDSSTDETRFIYSQTPFEIKAITAAASGLDKKVISTGDTVYSYDTVVGPNEQYTYRLRYANNYNSKSKNSILYDCMEAFTTAAGEPSAWRGRVLSIDVSQLIKMGIAPTVYYSTTVTDLSGVKYVTGENGSVLADAGKADITDTANWTKAAAEADNPNLVDLSGIEGITAIAIDFRKASDGSDFVLAEGQSVFLSVNMQAPDEVPVVGEITEDVKYPVTYNNVYIATTVENSLGEAKDYFLEQDYTSVRFHVVGNLYLTKVNAEDHDETISGITFRLYGTSDYGTNVDMQAATDRYGELVFKDVERGSYKLVEYSEDPDWQADHNERDVTIDGSGAVTVTYNALINTNSETDPYLFENKPRIHADVEFGKYELGSDTIALQGAKFKLTGISDYGNEITMYATSDITGKVVFHNLELGSSYIMKEVEAPAGYSLLNTEYTVIVDNNGNYRIELADSAYSDYFAENQGAYTVYNEKLHRFMIQKLDSWSYAELNGAEFRLYGTSDNKNTVDLTVTTDNTHGKGTAFFDGLESGTYILQETKAPSVTDPATGEVTQYILDDTKRIVTVSKNGEVTVSGIEYNEETKCFGVYNAPEKGSIKIVKVWEDQYGDDNTNRAEDSLEIMLSTKQPEYVVKNALFVPYQGGTSVSVANLFGISEFNAASVTSFSRYPGSLTEEQVKAIDGVRIISPETEEYQNDPEYYPVYGWVDESGHFYWWSEATTVKFQSSAGTSPFRMFEYLENLTSIDLNGTDTKEITNFQYAFYGCKNLESITGPLDTSSATNMNAMFQGCQKLTNIESIGDFDTSNVTNMGSMFYGCSALQTLNLSSFDTNDVEVMERMFQECKGLQTITFGKDFDTSQIKSMQSMFYQCSGLLSLDLSGFHTSNVTNMNSTFRNCSSLTELDVSGFDTSKVTNITSMFESCPNLKTIWASDTEACFGNISSGSSISMFSNSGNIRGALGTSTTRTAAGANVTVISSLYARIDKEDQPGLFTDVAEKNTAAAAAASFTAVLETAYANMDEWLVRTFSADEGDTDTEENTVTLSTITDTDAYTLEKNGNVWTYTFKVNEGTWYVWEDIVPKGYEIVNGEQNGSGSKWHEIAAADGDTVTITNRAKVNPPTYGSLTLNKKVFNEKDGMQIIGSETQYEFTVILTDSEGNALSGTAIYGNTVFTDGVATVNLSSGDTADGDTVTFTGIPSGYHYEITEAALDGITVTGEVKDRDETTSEEKNGTTGTFDAAARTAGGTISEATESYAAFVNRIVPRETGDFYIEKQVSNSDDTTIDYTLDVALTNLDKNAVYYVLKRAAGSTAFADYKSFTSDSDGDADVSITLKKGESVRFAAIQVDSTYQITEEAGEAYRASFVIHDANSGTEGNSGNILLAQDGNVNTNTELSTARETVESGEQITVTYTNEIVKTQDIKLVKAMDTPVGYDSALSFDFIIRFSGLDDGYTFNSGVGKLMADQSGNAEKTFSLTPGEEIVFSSIPVGVQYQITELDAGKYISSYRVTDSLTGTELYSGVDSDSGENKAQNTPENTAYATEQLTVQTNVDSTVTFTNILPTANLSVSKQVTGNFGDKTERFIFAADAFSYEGAGLTGQYTVEKKYADGTTETVGTVSFTAGSPSFVLDGSASAGGNTFELGHNEVLTIVGLPVGTTFRIEETGEGLAGKYITSYTISPEEAADASDSSAENSTVASGTVVKNGVTVAYVNEKEAILPTGIRTNGLLLLVLALGTGAAVMVLGMYIRRKRAENN